MQERKKERKKEAVSIIRDLCVTCILLPPATTGSRQTDTCR